jgi:hypothetical protein
MELILLPVIGIASRMLPHLPNATAVSALALFSGAKLGFRKAFFITLVSMLASDVFLGLHTTMWATYGALFITIILGNILLKKQNTIKVAGVTFLSSVIFYLLTNFAVWFSPQFMYPKTISGLYECYIFGLPFFRNSLLGDLMYSGIFFGGYEFVMSMLTRKEFRKTV